MLKIYFYTFGCKTNQYETRFLQRQLINAGGEEVFSFEKADFCVINSCTVTHQADADCRQLVRRISRANPSTRIIVTGCYAVRAPEEIRSACGGSSRIEILPVKDSIFSHLGYPLLSTHCSLLTGFNGRTRAFVKIQDGCDAFCSYCIVPYVRPQLWNRSPEETITEVKNLVANGHKEIVLTGIRLGRYQAPRTKFDAGQARGEVWDLVSLLKELEKIEGLYRIRLSSLEIHEISKQLLRLIAESKKICHHLHIPLQSGDDEVLKLMNRPYTSEEFRMKIEQIRHYLPDIAITTDIIVGFPQEEEKNFLSSYQFAQRVGFSRIHIFPYSARPGTVAATFGSQVPAKIKKIRMEKFLALSHHLQNEFRKKFFAQEMAVLLDKEEKDGTFSGFTSNYIRVYTKSGEKNEIVHLKIN